MPDWSVQLSDTLLHQLPISGTRQSEIEKAIEGTHTQVVYADTDFAGDADDPKHKRLASFEALKLGLEEKYDHIIFQMVDLDTVWIAAWIDINQMSQIKENQEATIRLRSGRQFPGRVERINLEADAVTREMEVDVKFDHLPSPLIIGEEAEVVISTGSMTAPCAPLTAMTERGGQTGILIVEQGRLVFRPVMSGLNDGKKFTCPRLLKEGDLVVMQPLNLKPGMRVKPEIKAPGASGK